MNKVIFKTFTHSLAFVAGFSAVFIIVFGLPAAYISKWITQHADWFGYIGGVIVVALGLHIMGSFYGITPFRFLMRETKVHLSGKPTGYFGTFLVGIVFAAGWTPCIGPILAAIFAVALSSPGAGVPMMIAYSAGLAIPFLVVALLFNAFLGSMRVIGRAIPALNFISGALLVAVGIGLFFGFITRYSAAAARVALWSVIYAVAGALAIWIVWTLLRMALASSAKAALRRATPAVGIVLLAVVTIAVFFAGMVYLSKAIVGIGQFSGEEALSGMALSLGVAFLGGLFSFLSPCVLPMVPSYIFYITGLSFEDLQPAKQ